MRVLFLTDRYPPDVVGGAEISLYHLINEMRKRQGLELHVVALSEKLDGVAEEVVDGVPVIRVPSRYDHRFPLPDVPVVVPWAREASIKKRSLWSRIEARAVSWLDRKLRAPVKKIVPAMKSHFKYLFVKTHSSFPAKLALFLANAVCSFSSGENIECLDEDFDRIVRTDGLREAVERLRPDLVHADNLRSILRYAELDLPFPAVALVRDLKFVCPRRIVLGHVGDRPCMECDFACLSEAPWIVRRLLRAVFKRNKAYRKQRLLQYRAVATTSLFLRDLLDRDLGIRAEVVPNTVGDLDALHAAKERLRRRGDFPTLASVGMMQKHKGVDYLIRVMPRVRERFPQARLMIAGAGGYEPTLRKIVENLKSSEYIRFVGFLSGGDLFQLYADCDVVVCFTRWPEPFGRVPLEAMFFERPVVASRQGGFLETVEHGETGLLVEPGNEEDLLAAVMQLLEDEGLRREMGRKGYERVLQHYSPEVVANRMFSLYERVVGHGR